MQIMAFLVQWHLRTLELSAYLWNTRSHFYLSLGWQPSLSCQYEHQSSNHAVYNCWNWHCDSREELLEVENVKKLADMMDGKQVPSQKFTANKVFSQSIKCCVTTEIKSWRSGMHTKPNFDGH